MPVTTLNPPGVAEPQGFMHVAVTEGSRTIYLAGQVSRDENGELVGAGDLAAQAEQALMNVHACLEAAGATFADVAKTTMYVVDWDESKLEQIFAGAVKVAERVGSVPVVPVTLIPVPKLVEDGLLIEIDSTAVLA